MTQCPECGAESVWNEDICSSICVQCGTLSDPSQSLLDSHTEHTDNSAHRYQTWLTSSAATLKSIRSQNNWNLAGQGKEVRERNNAIAMSTFITSVLARLNSPGLSPRAETLFTQAMTAAKYRWGRKAKLAAGASIAIALREAHKSDSLRDIAFLLDDSPVSLSRAFLAVVSLLQLDLESTDPTVHLPVLQAHLEPILRAQTSSLPADLIAILKPLRIHSAIHTAISMSGFVSRHTPALPITQLPTAPTACALLILGLEAEMRKPLPHIGELADALASRFGLGRGVVTARYKILYDLVEEWIREVPWLDQFVYKDKGRGKNARSRVSKRTIVARGLLDVIQFREEIWKKKVNVHARPSVVIEVDPTEHEDTEDEDGFHFPGASSAIVRVASSDNSLSTPFRKKLKTKHETMDDASQFLLNPLSASLPAINFPPFTHGMSSSSFLSPQERSYSNEADTPSIPLTSYILTCSPAALSRQAAPTRLELLTIDRGGSTTHHIDDEELFENGELEGILRTEQEREALRPLFTLEWGESARPSGEDSKSIAQHTHLKEKGTEISETSGRVDMKALARILRGEGHSDDEKSDVDEEDLESNADSLPPLPASFKGSNAPDSVEDVEAWRPLSPDNAFSGRYNSIDRYDEEY
ncbi:hypothetical protein BJ138DRAFT_1152434 [Hygrophoropsis aurantiaca]|uniref:Uncharacterized protein n=1 Tax=Hygrophoropsis aurantiaca TaxID=72124 RepID=A0ACB8ABZ7_9AGAM|nr:hypothetical protein BJ138DRAFT_1152434 [Hygrophoropsis aurantiaca]